jgi:hypothetical protein
MKKVSLQWKEPPFGTGRLRIKRATWRETICRLIRAEQEAERATNLMNAAVDAGTTIMNDNMSLREGIKTAENWAAVSIPAAKQAGRDEVLKLIARWGKARPLEGMGGADMAEALRKVLTPIVTPYSDYKGITQAVTDGDVKLTDIPMCDAKSGERA